MGQYFRMHYNVLLIYGVEFSMGIFVRIILSFPSQAIKLPYNMLSSLQCCKIVVFKIRKTIIYKNQNIVNCFFSIEVVDNDWVCVLLQVNSKMFYGNIKFIYINRKKMRENRYCIKWNTAKVIRYKPQHIS